MYSFHCQRLNKDLSRAAGRLRGTEIKIYADIEPCGHGRDWTMSLNGIDTHTF